MKTAKWAALLALCILILFTGCGKEQGPLQTGTARKIRGVEIAEARHKEIDVTFRASGTVRAVTRSTLAGKIMGNVTRVLVGEGDRVEKGETLIEIESRDIVAKIRQAQGALESATAALRNAEANFNRTSKLFARGSATRFELDRSTMQLDSAKGRVKQAEGAVKEARVMKQYSLIRAPMTGVITRRMVEVGDQAAPGRPLLEFEDKSHLQFETFVPESIFPSLEIGQKVSVRIDALGDDLIPGRIAEMEASADPVSHSTKVKIDLEKTEDALSGMYGKALITIGKRGAIMIPKKAVVKRGQLTAVYVLDPEKTLHFRLIQTGRPLRDQIEVLSGLEGGERIAVSKLDQLEDGMGVPE